MIDMDKFKEAIINLARCRNEYDLITNKIGIELSKCSQEICNEINMGNINNIEPHIIKGFILIKKSSYADRPLIEDFIDECEFCKNAYRLICERKVIKAKFGHAKRWVTRLGNNEIKDVGDRHG